MSKISKNLGITKACPVCNNVIVKNLNVDFLGEGSLELLVKCPHCKENDDKDIYIRIEIETVKKTKITLTKIIIPLAFILLIGGILGTIKISNSVLSFIPWQTAK